MFRVSKIFGTQNEHYDDGLAGMLGRLLNFGIRHALMSSLKLVEMKMGLSMKLCKDFIRSPMGPHSHKHRDPQPSTPTPN